MKQYNNGEQNRTHERRIMEKDFINLTIRVDFRSPFHIGTGYGMGLLDRTVCRDHQGYIYLPG